MTRSYRVDLGVELAGEDGCQLWRWLLVMLLFFPSASASVNDPSVSANVEKARISLRNAQDRWTEDVGALTISECNIVAVNDLLSLAVNSFKEGKYHDTSVLLNTAKSNLSDCSDTLASMDLNVSQAALDISAASADIADALRFLSTTQR